MKIALIAMSGVRANDEELLRLGLTLPGFVERSKTIASLPSLGLLTLAALTPAHHDLHYIEVEDLKTAGPLPTDFDLVAVSSVSAQIDEAYALAGRYRAAGVPVVMGGLHVTAVPDEAARHCDAVVVGEGEPVWSQVLEDAEAGRLARFYDARALRYDVAGAPIPRYDLLDVSRYNRLTVQTSRGCPHRCDFCAASPMLTDVYKQKPVEKVLQEIDRICEIWPRPFIEFADDNAFVNKKYWRRLLPPLVEKNLRWFAETDLSVADDPALLELMRESGCAQVLIGLESPVSTGLGGVEMKRDWKLRRFERYRTAVHTIQSHGITVNGCFIIGLDGHTEAIFDDVFAFVRETGLYEVQVTVLTPFPGTPLYRRLEREGRLLEPGNWKKCTLFDVNYVPTHMTPEALAQGFRDLVVKLYSDDFTRWRRAAYRQQRRTYGREEVPA